MRSASACLRRNANRAGSRERADQQVEQARAQRGTDPLHLGRGEEEQHAVGRALDVIEKGVTRLPSQGLRLVEEQDAMTVSPLIAIQLLRPVGDCAPAPAVPADIILVETRDSAFLHVRTG